jgi:hypothetical protein
MPFYSTKYPSCLNPTTFLSLTIYPNPGNGFLSVEISNITSNAFVEIYNSSGVLVFEQPISTVNGIIDLTDQAYGSYLVKVLKVISIWHLKK